jgi:hypothetical protein
MCETALWVFNAKLFTKSYNKLACLSLLDTRDQVYNKLRLSPNLVHVLKGYGKIFVITKHSSLFRQDTNYRGNKFYITGSRIIFQEEKYLSLQHSA